MNTLPLPVTKEQLKYLDSLIVQATYRNRTEANLAELQQQIFAVYELAVKTPDQEHPLIWPLRLSRDEADLLMKLLAEGDPARGKEGITRLILSHMLLAFHVIAKEVL